MFINVVQDMFKNNIIIKFFLLNYYMNDLIKTSQEFYKDTIESRFKFSKLIKDNFKEQIQEIILKPFYKEFKDNKNIVIWLGGSSSWENFFNCNYNGIIEDLLIQSSIIAGNFDIFVLTDNKETYDIASCFLFNLIKKFKENFEESGFAEKYKLTNLSDFSDKKGVCVPNVESTNENCVLFPCQAHQLNIQSKSKGELKKKLLIYFEAYYIKDVNILVLKELVNNYCNNSFKDLGIPYLNEKGLLIFSEFIIGKRTEKGINVDKYRKELLLNFLSGYINLSELYVNLLNYYIIIFLNTKKYNKNITNKLLLNIFKYDNKDINDIIEQNIITSIRPLINMFINELSKDIKIHFENSFLCIIGGDAMRRYNYNITKTTDYDIKLFLPLKYTKKKNKEIFNTFLIERLSYFVSFLITNKNNILLNNVNEYIFNAENGVIIKCSFNILTDFSSQFRLRYIQKHPGFNIDLYSIDFRTIVFINIINGSQFHTYNINIDIPILDIVIHTLDNKLMYSNQSESDIVNNSFTIPIASLDFLLHNIETMYNKDPSNRYFNNKNEKDLYRYNILNNLKNEHLDFKKNLDIDITFDTELYKTYNSDTVNELSQKYNDYFSELIKEENIKHKMSFNFGSEYILKEDFNDSDVELEQEIFNFDKDDDIEMKETDSNTFSDMETDF